MQGFPEMAGEMWDIFGWMYHEIPLLKRWFLDNEDIFGLESQRIIWAYGVLQKEICTIQGLADMYDMYNGVFICISVDREG